ncbi:PrsW family intramembrane metalloprotease [bacterium]|nr:PrsW family intramembrane metalloprotease [bacterium]MBU1072238.1 PrsW family intramembrane metalloprotease [bacterium]MBU1676835.1 PrsW family intramembrane metalloprotease [bacterium]
MKLLIIAVSAIAGIIAVARLRHLDVHEKEPWRALALVTLVGGAWSIAISTVLYAAFGAAGIGNVRNTLGAILVVGPLEEAAKLLAMLSCLPLFRRHLDEPADGVIYMACVALGFSLIENYFYATSAQNAGGLLMVRLLTATPAHILFSFPMGLAVYARRRGGARRGLLGRAYLYASLSHGVWDVLAFNGLALILFFALLWPGMRFFGTVMSYAARVSPFREDLTGFLSAAPAVAAEEDLMCLACGNTGDKPAWLRGKIRVQRCESCDSYISSWDGLFFLFRHFGGWYGRLEVKPAPDGERDGLFTVEAGNVASRGDQVAAFRLSELSPVLDELGERAVAEVEGAWWFPDRGT